MYSATDKNVKQLSSFYEYASCAVCQVQHYGRKGSFYIKEVHLEYIWIILGYTNTGFFFSLIRETVQLHAHVF